MIVNAQDLAEPISIHAPREGRDAGRVWMDGGHNVFQSTRPVRGATVTVEADRELSIISIHAPREGRDPRRILHLRSKIYFNPRAP